MQNYEVTFRKTVNDDECYLAHSSADAERKFLEEYENLLDEVEIISIRREG